MKKIYLISLFTFGILFGSSRVGIAIKVSNTVTILSENSESESPLKPGMPLNDGDVIKTGKQSFTAAMYLDDKSLVKVMQNSELTIRGKKGDDGLNKELEMSYGKLKAKISKQNGKEFRISTPTSVASVKGTELAITSDPVNGDSFTLIEGLIEVSNSVTGETVEVNEGETATSNADGSLDVHETTDEDLSGYDENQQDEEQETQELRFEIEDENGNIKEIIIQYN